VSGTLTNNGWAILPWPNGNNGWAFNSADEARVAMHPLLRVYYSPPIIIGSIVRGSTSATLQFTGPPNASCTVLRATTVTGTYSNIGSATVQPDGTATFTDNSPPAGAAFYRISNP
jgi:hypothetical protein